MDPLSSLSIACGVMQVGSFGLETISLCKKIYTNDYPDSRLAESGRQLGNLGTSITQHLTQGPQTPTAKEKAFLKVVKQCVDDAKVIQEKVDHLAPKNVHQIRAAVSAAGRSFWPRRSRVRETTLITLAMKSISTPSMLSGAMRIIPVVKPAVRMIGN